MTHAEQSVIIKLSEAKSIINSDLIQVSMQVGSGGSNSRSSSGVKGTVFYEGLPCPPASDNGRIMPGCTGPLSNYEVIVYAEDGTSVIARTRSDDRGNYSVLLPPGNYVIYTPAGPLPSMRIANHIIIKENQIVTKDLTIDTGVR